MSQYRGKTGGLEEAKIYMHDKEIPQLFESMMTALMFKKPENHLDFLEQCLVKAKKNNKVKWHTFIEPLPPIPRTENKVEQEHEKVDDVSNQNARKTYSPLPPIAANVQNEDIVTVDNNSSEIPNDTVETGNKEGLDTDASTAVEEKVQEEGNIELGIPSSGDSVDIGDDKLGMDNDDTSTTDNKIETSEVVGDTVKVDSEDINVVSEKNIEETEVNVEDDEVEVGTSVENEDKSSEQETNTVAEVAEKDGGEGGTSVENEEEKSSEQEENTLTEVIGEDEGEVGASVDNEEKSSEQEATTVTEVIVEDEGEVGASVENEEKSSEQEANTVAEVIEVPEWNDDSTEKEGEALQAFSKPVIFVIGGPGSGKGTQCEKIVEKYSFLHLSAGDLLRQEATKGGEIAAIMEQGQLVPQEITIGLLKQAMLDNHESKGFLIDGFPREIQQAQTFESEVTIPKLVLNYSCPDEVLVERLLARGKHSGRVDDNEESIKKRLDLFHGKSEPVIGHYGDIVKTIDSSQPVHKVFDDTCEVLGQLSQEKNEIIVDEPIVVPVDEDVIPGKEKIRHLFGDTIKNKSFVFVAGFEGCGKKEQYDNIVQKFGYTLISLDDILKAEIQTGTDRAKVVSDTLENGGVVSEEIIMELIGEALLNIDVDKVLIDGFPRNISEAEQFESQITTAKIFIYFSCLFETLIEKLGSSENDNEIEKQLQSFHTTVLPVLEKYKERGTGLEISMQSSEADVSVSIQNIFDEPTGTTDNTVPDFYGH